MFIRAEHPRNLDQIAADIRYLRAYRERYKKTEIPLCALIYQERWLYQLAMSMVNSDDLFALIGHDSGITLP